MSVDDFVKCLADTGLIPRGEIEKLRERLANSEAVREAESLAQTLVRERLLTDYQAKVLLTGDSSGLVLGNYTVLDKIGQGGMGRVYKAWHRRMKRVVAIKTLPTELTRDEKAIQRFRREVEMAAQLSHRNIVTAYDADEVSGIHFLVMEYVDGQNLNLLVKERGPLSVIDAVRCVIDAAHGLHYAHRQGIVHRDIKPANLLLDSKGMVKVLDLGLARTQDFSAADSAHSPGDLTSEETVVGTADYLAPEQAVTPKRADHRVDVYSLGITLYYLLAGKIPYPGENVLERLVAHRERPVPSLREARPDVPLELAAICQKMMAKVPEQRYQNLGEVIRALEDFLRRTAPDLPDGAPIGLPGDRPGRDADFLQTVASLAETMPLERPRIDRWMIPWLVALAVGGIGGFLLWQRKPADGLSSADAASWRVQGEPPQPSGRPMALLPPSGKVEGGGFPASPVDAGHVVPSEGPPQRGMALPGAAGPPSGAGEFWPAVEVLRGEFERAFPGAPQFEGHAFDAEEAARRQQAWAAYLNIPVECRSSAGMPLVLIPPGVAQVGTPAEEVEALVQEGRATDQKPWYLEQLPAESPLQLADIVFPILAGQFEVSEPLFRSLMNPASAAKAPPESSPAGAVSTTDSSTSGAEPRDAPHSPAHTVDWWEAVEFCNRLSEHEGLQPCYTLDGDSVILRPGNGYRLPAEREWEYLCRAGTTTRWHFGDDRERMAEYGHCDGREGVPRPSGLLLPNAWRMFDLYGNLWEWCQDVQQNNQPNDCGPLPLRTKRTDRRAVRGGSFPFTPEICRSASRTNYFPHYARNTHGLRVIREVRQKADVATMRLARP